MSYELYIPPKRLYYNPTNGQFLKGHPNCNKGKKWYEFMPKKAQERCKKGWANVDKFRTMNTDTLRLKAQLSILRDVTRQYGGLTIDNVIQQIESRIKELKKHETENQD